MITDMCADPREALIDELIALAPQEDRLVVLDADVSRARRFRDAFPDRFYLECEVTRLQRMA